MKVLLGTPPKPPPETINAEVIKSLVHPIYGEPCEDGLEHALDWIGDQSMSLSEALEASKGASNLDIKWAKEALGIQGSGYGYGYSYGYGYGHAYGDGHPYGEGHCYGYGHAYGDGHPYGEGHAYGDVA